MSQSISKITLSLGAVMVVFILHLWIRVGDLPRMVNGPVVGSRVSSIEVVLPDLRGARLLAGAAAFPASYVFVSVDDLSEDLVDEVELMFEAARQKTPNVKAGVILLDAQGRLVLTKQGEPMIRSEVPLFHDVTGLGFRAFNIRQTPLTVSIDSRGFIARVWEGLPNASEMERH